MSLYAVVSNKTEPVPLSELVFPARIYFIVSDINHGALLNISLNIYDADGELGNETFDLPFVLNYQDKYFYSCTHRRVQSIGDSESTPTPEKTPTPTPEKTPTPTSGGDVTQNGQMCVDGITIENDEISFGIELRDSPGQIIVDPKDYVPSPAIPIVVYIFIHSATTENYCGKITLNSRNEGISETSFNNTTFSYLHSDDRCYNYDLNGVTGNDNFIVFGESVSEKLETCCGGLEVISAESNSNAGVQLSDATGFLCYDAKTFNYSPGLPTIVYIYLNDTDSSSYQGKITIENRVGGLSLDNFNSLEFVYIDIDDSCYKANFSDINELNNIKIFNTYN